jgi:exodeoxyribonuclease VII small subunit
MYHDPVQEREKSLGVVYCMTFSEDMESLQELVTRLDSGEMSLEESLDLFEKGISLVKSCRTFLESARQRISLVSMDQDDPEGKPWDPLNDDPRHG